MDHATPSVGWTGHLVAGCREAQDATPCAHNRTPRETTFPLFLYKDSVGQVVEIVRKLVPLGNF
ncbi:MAG: hypothetical protein C0478_16775 [Planctomyces sp.]|nr:hypothetical protein [Planctomyces sp.]